jgi:hypothetical protein
VFFELPLLQQLIFHGGYMFEKESRKIELVLERGRLRVQMTEDHGQTTSKMKAFKAWLITGLSWVSLGLGVASYLLRR